MRSIFEEDEQREVKRNDVIEKEERVAFQKVAFDMNKLYDVLIPK